MELKLGDRVIFGTGDGLMARIVAITEHGIVLAAEIAPGVTRPVCEAYGFAYHATHALGCRERMLKLLTERDLALLQEKGLLRPAPAPEQPPF